jgi:hypothetical protein
LRQAYHRFRNHFGHTGWYSYEMTFKWKLVLVRLEKKIVLILIQDRCTVCAKRTVDSEIILDASDGTPR